MAKTKTSKSNNLGLTGHVAEWATSGGMSGNAKRNIRSRTNRIDAAVDAATGGTSASGVKPVKQQKGPWPWQSK